MRRRCSRGESRNDESDTSSSSETSHINNNKAERKRRSRSTTKTRHSSKNKRKQRKSSRSKSSSSSSKSTMGSNKASERGHRGSSTGSSSSNCSNISRGSKKGSSRARRRSSSTPETRKYKKEFRNMCGKGPSKNKYSERSGNYGKRRGKSGDRQRSTHRSHSRTRDNGGRPRHGREKKHGLDRSLSLTKRGMNRRGRSCSSSPDRGNGNRYERSPGPSRKINRSSGSSGNTYRSSKNNDRSPGGSGNKYSYKDQARERSQWRSSSSLEDEYLRTGDSLFNNLRKKQGKYLNSHRSTLDDWSEIREEIFKLHPGLSRYEPSQGEDIRLLPKQSANITPINAHVFPQTASINPASVSFEWQFQDEHGSWISYGKPNSAGTVAHITTTSSDYIEKHYVTNAVNPTPITISSRNNAQYFLDLKNLTQTNLQSGVKKKIRRVLKDSPSSTITPKGSAYVWSFKDDDGNWIRYGETSSSNEATSATTTTSDNIETKYARNPTASLEIANGNHSYIIDFNSRTQTNIKTKAVRAIRRKLVTPSDLPSNWTPMDPSEKGLRVVPLSLTDKESIKQVSFVKRTLPSNFTITKVFRIQNEHLWMDFVNGKERLKKRNPQINYKEVYLFHGTDPKHVQAICAENLDFRLRGSNGTSYGQGTYFATSAAYSANYAGSGKTKLMFIVKVLIGYYTVGDSSLCRPPKDESGVFYDATVDDEANPTIYVKYVNTEYYPEYYFEFT